MSTFGLDFPGLTPGRLLSWLCPVARRWPADPRPSSGAWSPWPWEGSPSPAIWPPRPSPPRGRSYLGSGRRYSSDDLLKITRELDKQRVRYSQFDDHRIAVAADAA